MVSNVKPLVAIVGRPNVGKSTLFNRLVGKPTAIVSDIAGTTRDRVMVEIEWGEYPFILVDTGGLDIFPETDLWRQVKGQIDVAIDEADVIIMMVDTDAGVTPGDVDVAGELRKTDTPIVLVANKADNDRRQAAAVEFYELGMGEPIPISAYHNIGIDEMMAEVIARFPNDPAFPEPDSDLKLAIVGRPNVGKSLLLNTIAGEDRAIVSEIPGTTRDTLDTLIVHNDWSTLLIDTAGIRRRGSVERGIERYSVLRSMRAIDRADVVVLLMDASELASSQDSHIAKYILDGFKGIVLAVNKWDLAKGLELTEEKAIQMVRDRFRFASYAPICLVSALEGTGIDELLDTAKDVFVEWSKGVPRYDLRRRVMTAVAEHPPSQSGRRSLKIYGVTMDKTGPPSFTFYVNSAEMVHFSYARYLENTIRGAYEFRGSPLRMRFKGRGEQ
ncbi:MAG: ribosome biogenesis GTPase Der [Chloroflexi bacterium]|nr:ribosome biogenesis GTPase Der [Chloroflexota bacterium]